MLYIPNCIDGAAAAAAAGDGAGSGDSRDGDGKLDDRLDDDWDYGAAADDFMIPALDEDGEAAANSEIKDNQPQHG